MRSGVACAIALAGCDAVFQLSPLEPPNVRGDVLMVFPEQQSDGTYRVVEQPPSFTVELALLTSNGEQPIPLAADGTFVFFATAGETYRFTFQADTDPYVTEYQLTSSELKLRRFFFDRIIDRKPVSAPTIVTFNLTAGSTTGSHAITSTGMRSHTTLPTTTIATPTVDWQAAVIPDGGTIALLDEQYGDRLHWLHFESFTPAPVDYYRATERYSAAVTMTSGQPVTVPSFGQGLREALPLDRCVSLSAPRLAELARIREQIGHLSFGEPREYTVWDISSTANVELGPNRHLFIAYVATSASLEQANVQYSNPYPGEQRIARMAAFVYRTFRAAGAANPSEGLAMGATSYVPIANDDCTSGYPPVAVPAGQLALPTLFSLGGEPIDSDGETIVVARDELVPFEFELGPGDLHDATIVLYEIQRVGSGANTSTSLEPLRQWVTPTNRLLVDPSLLARGRTYTFLVNTRLNYPNARDGDYSVVSYPIVRGRSFSPMFVPD